MTVAAPARNLPAMESFKLLLDGVGAGNHALLRWVYFCSGFVMAGSYVPQVVRAWRHPVATAIAQSLSSWLLWTACRFVALLYGLVIVGDGLFIAAIGFDLAGRVALLVAMLRARRVAAGAQADPRGRCARPWRCLLLAGCVCVAACQPHATPHPPTRAIAATPAAPSDDEAAFQRRALNVLLLPLVDDDEPPRWAAVEARDDCGAAPRVSVDGRPVVAGEALPARAFQLVWSGTTCGGFGDDIVEVSGTVTLWIFHDGDAWSAVVEPDRLRVVTGGGGFVLTRRFAARTPLASPAPAAGSTASHSARSL